MQSKAGDYTVADALLTRAGAGFKVFNYMKNRGILSNLSAAFN
jgi:hypothetical protein